MSNKPIIAVTGATGAQGGSVVRFLLKDGGFQVRALTRNVDSDAAKGMLKLDTRLTSILKIVRLPFSSTERERCRGREDRLE